MPALPTLSRSSREPPESGGKPRTKEKPKPDDGPQGARRPVDDHSQRCHLPGRVSSALSASRPSHFYSAPALTTRCFRGGPFEFPNLLRISSRKELFRPAFIPVFTDYLVNKDKKEAFRLGNLVVNARCSSSYRHRPHSGILATPWIDAGPDRPRVQGDSRQVRASPFSWRGSCSPSCRFSPWRRWPWAC